MRTRFLSTLLVCLIPALPSFAAEDEAAPHTNMKDVLRARMAEDARKQPAPNPSKPPASSATAEAAAAATAAPATGEKPASAPPAAAPKPAGAATAKPATAAVPPPTVLPKVEVKKSRITVLDQQLAQQEQDIARERKNLKTTEVDTALNDAKIAKPLAIFGGESAQFRKRVASERVALMEAEKDVIEAIAHAKTKDEKEKLQKELDELKSARRELEKSLR